MKVLILLVMLTADIAAQARKVTSAIPKGNYQNLTVSIEGCEASEPRAFAESLKAVLEKAGVKVEMVIGKKCFPIEDSAIIARANPTADETKLAEGLKGIVLKDTKKALDSTPDISWISGHRSLSIFISPRP